MKLPRAAPVVAAAGAAVLVFGLWSVTSWTLIPTRVDGQVENVTWQSDTGLRFKELHLSDGRTVVVDRWLADELTKRAGSHKAVNLRTGFGSTTARVDGRPVDLGLPRTWWETSAALSLVVAVGVGRAVLSHGRHA